METKSLAPLTALTDKWGALENRGPSLWAGEGGRKKKKKVSPSQLTFFLFAERGD